MAKRKIITSKTDIVNHWVKYIDECGFPIDWSEALEYCWRCGCKSNLERCHIIPHSLGGLDNPDNLVLLCNFCHHEAPNIYDRDFFWEWLTAYAVPFYDTFWTIRSIKEYEFIYKVDFYKECEEFEVKEGEYQLFVEQNLDKFNFHWGQSRLNIATRVGIIKLFMISKGKVFEKPKCYFPEMLSSRQN